MLEDLRSCQSYRMSTSRTFFDQPTADCSPTSRSEPPRMSSLPRFVSAPASTVGIDQPCATATTPSPVSTAPPLINVATPTSTPSLLTMSELSPHSSSTPSCPSTTPRIPVSNLDAAAPSPDPDSPPTDSASSNRPVRSVSLSTVTQEYSTPGQPSLFCDIKQHHLSNRNNTDTRLTFRLHEQLRFVLPSLTTTATQRLCYFSTLLYCQRTPTHL